MKCLLSLLCFAVLFSCSANTNHDPVTGEEIPVVKGKLYIESSIVGGLRLSWLWLGDDGTFVGNPRHGADPINYAMEKTDNAAQIGHYTKTGNMISAKYENGKTENWPVEYLNGKLNTIDGLFVGVADVMPANYKLSGRYSAGTFLTNVGSIRTFTFKTDGSFVLEGQGFIRNDAAAASSKAATGGTYSVTGNTLKLNYNNGESSVSVIGVYKTGSSNFLVINESFFSGK